MFLIDFYLKKLDPGASALRVFYYLTFLFCFFVISLRKYEIGGFVVYNVRAKAGKNRYL